MICSGMGHSDPIQNQIYKKTYQKFHNHYSIHMSKCNRSQLTMYMRHASEKITNNTSKEGQGNNNAQIQLTSRGR